MGLGFGCKLGAKVKADILQEGFTPVAFGFCRVPQLEAWRVHRENILLNMSTATRTCLLHVRVAASRYLPWPTTGQTRCGRADSNATHHVARVFFEKPFSGFEHHNQDSIDEPLKPPIVGVPHCTHKPGLPRGFGI